LNLTADVLVLKIGTWGARRPAGLSDTLFVLETLMIDDCRFYEESFGTWQREFVTAAKADQYCELLRPAKDLRFACSPKDTLTATVLAVDAVISYMRIDGIDWRPFLEQQQYHPQEGIHYVILLKLKERIFARILTGRSLEFVDLVDLFHFPWDEYEVAGFETLYITKLNGRGIGKSEWKRLQGQIESDIYCDYEEEEISVVFRPSTQRDTAELELFEIDPESAAPTLRLLRDVRAKELASGSRLR
jgi:hypothetical protein